MIILLSEQVEILIRYFFSHPTELENIIIFVDECQDIDDIRGNFILLFCQEVGIKSLTLFGDPRQNIRSNCGKMV